MNNLLQLGGLILPAVCMILCIWMLMQRHSVGISFGCSLLIIYSWAFLGTVGLSLLGMLAAPATWIWWSVLFLLLILSFALIRKTTRKTTFIGFIRWPQNLDSVEWLSLLALTSSLGGALLMGLFSAPNNGDVLIYHLPRQLIWISEGSVFLSSAPYEHMQKMPPLTEWIGVQLYLLTGTDRFHFLIQWFAFAGCLVALAAIVTSLGGFRKQALLAAAFFALLPSAFFQASNSKNDLVLTAFLLGIFWLALSAWKNQHFSILKIMGCAYLAGLAVLAKGTAFAYLPFAAIAVGAVILQTWQPIMIIRIVFGLAVFLGTISLHYLNNFSKILSAESGSASQHANANPGIATGASVFLRNVSLQFALPIGSWNQFVQKSTESLALKTGVPTDDPDSTFHGAPFDVSYKPYMEDRATGFFHFAIPLVILFGGFAWMGTSTFQNAAIISALVFLFSVFLFSVLFRYQLWHSRLMIPAAALAAPGAGIFLGSIRWQRVSLIVVVLMGLWLVPSYASWSRPLVGRLNVFNMPEDVAIGRAGSGAIFLPLFGKTMADAGVKTVWLDLQNGVVHSALRYLPLSTKYGYPQLESTPADNGLYDTLLTNLPPEKWSPQTQQIVASMEFVASMEGWCLFLKPELAKIARSSPHLPRISGVEVISGLGEWQGPYPEWNIDRFALLDRDGATIKFSKLPNQKQPSSLRIGKSSGWGLEVLVGSRVLQEMSPDQTTLDLKLEGVEILNPPTLRLIPKGTPVDESSLRIHAIQLLPEPAR